MVCSSSWAASRYVLAVLLTSQPKLCSRYGAGHDHHKTKLDYRCHGFSRLSCHGVGECLLVVNEGITCYLVNGCLPLGCVDIDRQQVQSTYSKLITAAAAGTAVVVYSAGCSASWAADEEVFCAH